MEPVYFFEDRPIGERPVEQRMTGRTVDRPVAGTSSIYDRDIYVENL